MKRRKSRKKKTRNPKVLAVSLVIMGLFIAELLFYTWCRVQCVQNRYEISELKVRQERLVAHQDSLKVELARLKSPKRIAKIAKQQLGLIAPTSKQLIIIP
ncbi:MAG: cell division protein FtsL [Deltaproteobacteria bacterium]|nr:cell division protein FtsL [Deltaproteobacteria bacterium]